MAGSTRFRPRQALVALGVAAVLGCAAPRPPAAPAPAGRDSLRGGAGAVTPPDVDRYRSVPVRQVEELIAGRFPGVQVMRTPGGGFSIRIRGPSTIMGSNEPLYVVDGTPFEPTPGMGLTWLVPGDIATIDILKDAISIAQYGVRGANGVVVITTRRGRHR